MGVGGLGRRQSDTGPEVGGAGQDEEGRVATVDQAFGFGWRGCEVRHLHGTKAWRAVAPPDRRPWARRDLRLISAHAACLVTTSLPASGLFLGLLITLLDRALYLLSPLPDMVLPSFPLGAGLLPHHLKDFKVLRPHP